MRGWTDSTGIFHERNVAESFGERGRIQMASNVSMSVLVAAVCTVGDCGVGVGLPVSPSNDQLLYRTLDGGITWEEFGTLPPSTFIYDVAGDQVLVGDFTNATPGPSYRGAYRWYPSGVTVMPPARCSSHEGCLQAGGWRPVANGSVGPGVVVVIQEGLEGVDPLGIAQVRAAVGPLPLQRLVERLGFTVGLWPIWLRVIALDRKGVGRLDEGPRATVAQGVVGEDALDRNAGDSEGLDRP